jgi:hypothetical protein
MRNIVNFSLLFSFISLTVTGVMNFVQPFSTVTMRVHIVFALVTVALVTWHFISRLSYFKKQLHSRTKANITRQSLMLIMLLWVVLLVASSYNLYPIDYLIAHSYEAKQQSQIVRPNPLAATLLEPAKINTRRQNKDTDAVAVSLYGLLNFSKAETAGMAIWAETPAGTLIETLYISPDLAYSDTPTWHGKVINREQVLPVWRHRYTAVSGVAPGGEIDAVSGATKKHQFSLSNYLTMEGEQYIVYFEINLPFDSNETWTDEHIGQPSVLYSAYVDPANGGEYTLLELTGHGGRGDQPDVIYYDMQSLTTAKKIVELVMVHSEPKTI